MNRFCIATVILTVMVGIASCAEISIKPAPTLAPPPPPSPAPTPTPTPSPTLPGSMNVTVTIPPQSVPTPTPIPAPSPAPPPTPPPTPSPSPVPPPPTPPPTPVPEIPQRFEIYLKPGAAVGASFSISKILEVGEKVNGLIEISDTESHSTDYRREVIFEALNPEGKSVYSWIGNYEYDNNHEFSFDISDAGKYIIKITHHSNYRKALYIKILPPGWTSE